MNIFFKEHQEILNALLKHHVSFMLIGGYAVNYYGYHRTTGDMDIWLEPSNENKALLLQALAALGFDEEGIEIINGWDFTTPQKFHIGSDNQPDKTEFMTHISGITFQDAASQKANAIIDGLQLPIIHYNSLIQNKESTGRTKDLADVEYLKKIMRLKNK
ncbi:MAG TPA: hypothetical protein PLQ78_03500 [Flavipsychrobacter sp.]|nr:hypothetical protein [Flavipsychrobacter sp.]